MKGIFKMKTITLLNNEEVAKQGYYHEILKNDKWKEVREMVLFTPSKYH